MQITVISSRFRLFPDKPVKPGDTWTASTQLNLDIKMPFTSTYTFKDIRANRAIIGVEAHYQTRRKENLTPCSRF